MDQKGVNRLSRRAALKVGFSIVAVSILAACGASATTQVAPSPTPAPAQVTSGTATQLADSPTSIPTATHTGIPTADPTQSATATASSKGSASTTPANRQPAVFQIDSGKSLATFTLGEVLLGKPNTVKGSTNKVTGSISVTLANPADSQIGTIQIDASTLHTDSGMRDRMIQRFILQSQQQYQFITFQPTAIQGLPATVKIGETIPISITGNLKIRDVMKPVTFDATVTMKSATELVGDAKATIQRSDFNLQIPNVPSVASVTDPVTLELQFVATRQ